MCKKRLLSVWVLPLVILTISACNARVSVIRGSGNLITETRQVSNFDSIELSGSGEVIVTQDGSESLRIETDDNVMEHIKADVEGGTLKLGLVTGIQTGINIQSTSRLVFYVSVDDLSGLTTSGSGEFESDRIDTSHLDLSVSGSGAIRIADLSASDVKADIGGSGGIDLAGDVAAQDISIDGSGKYQAGDLCSGSVKVSVGGSGSATVCATETLDADISGSGSINYYGSPSINTSNSGSGKINNLGEK
jgi:Putative auto-transporter adhesin, head GIN domain